MGKVKKLYCPIHDRWFDPREGLCPLCEVEEDAQTDSLNNPINDEENESFEPEFLLIQPVSFEGQVLDSEDLRLYQEQALRNIEEVHKRIKRFRFINALSIIIFMALLIILFLI
ncbi:MAG: hypothetical protein OdinLCB4_001835 [Candidatus Odinarchaeum yellowstonii]|uniref:Uncharacterized protein n=1 Tax=Odinarchaeota yellowstonii (strain LCB_4) TaxID=1841599 RepID=A0AAF0D2V4_ODILC|nr:MAG: hypothetical protein OdinLCB4_001835 [Candidatus Odinarchaeum yellowstonii]